MRWTTWTEYIVGTIVCILVLLGIRWVFRKKINPNVQYFLWILVALRILLPVHFQVVLPHSEWTERLETALRQVQRSENSETVMMVGDRQNGSETFPEEESKPTVGAIHLPSKTENEYIGTFLPLVPEKQETVEGKTENQQGVSLWLPIWLRGIGLIGMVVFALFMCIMNMHWYRRIRGSRRRVGTLEHGLPLYEAEGMNCLWGCFRPAVYLSPEVLATEERKAHVLQHELEHYRAKDHIWVLVRILCLLVQWYNPLVWVAYYEAGKDCETACDYRVTKQMTRQERIAYGESLLWVVEYSVMKKRGIYPAASMGEDKKLLAKRLEDIVKGKQKKMIIIPCVILALVAAGLFVTMTVSKQDSIPTNQDPEPEDIVEQEKIDMQETAKEQVKAARKYLHKFPKEDMVVIPQVKEYTYEEAAALGEVQECRSFLPGAAEGSWYIVTIEGICYFYGKYDHQPQEEQPTLMGASYAIVGEQYSLANGLKVGMTEQEVLERYPNMEVVDFENQPVYKERKIWGCMGWNNGHYPDGVEVTDGTSEYSWLKQFDYIMIGDVDQGSYDTLPVYVGLLVKDKVVQAITFQYPTAG